MRTPTTSPTPLEEDTSLVKIYVLHTLALDVLERDIRVLRDSPLKMPDVYIHSLSRVQQRMTAQLTVVRGKMRQQGIKIYSEVRSKQGVEALYVCRGYQRRFFMLSSFAKSEVRVEISRYLGIDLTQG